MSHLLTVDNLVITAGRGERRKNIVNDVSFTLDRGEVLGLIGESGAGKSTIGLAVLGYTRPGCDIVSGRIVFDGIDITAADYEVKRSLRGTRLAYVAQSAAASFNPAHRLIDQCTEAALEHELMKYAEVEERVIELFRRFLLPDPENIGKRYPHQVSGGQLQRAMVAMAMSCAPDVVIFDEPTTALDVTTQVEVLVAIKEAVKMQNAAAIYITHDLAVVAQVADKIMVLRYGDMVEMAPTRELLASPKKEYTHALLSTRSGRDVKEPVTEKREPLLQVENLRASYTRGPEVLSDINLTVERGKTVAVVGESGSGKTSLARSVVGLLPPSQGRIVFAGEELPPKLKDRNRDMLRRLQMVYQMPDVALNPRQKVKQVIGRVLEFYFGMKGKAQQDRVAELLTMCELPKRYMERYPPQLSGGEKQRVCIARALAAQPDLMICDEVTSALDQLVGEEILKLLQQLQDELQLSYLFITHDLATVKVVSDEIVVMLEGRIVEQGPREEVLRPPHHEYTDKLLAAVPEMDPDWLNNLLQSREARLFVGGGAATT